MVSQVHDLIKIKLKEKLHDHFKEKDITELNIALRLDGGNVVWSVSCIFKIHCSKYLKEHLTIFHR